MVNNIKIDKEGLRCIREVRQYDLIYNTFLEEISKVRKTFNIQAPIDLRILFANSKVYWGNIKTDRHNDETHYVATITLSKLAIKQRLQNTIMHELLHLVSFENGHYGKWEQYANIINIKYNYQIHRVE